ncbi:MAG: 16S rRNA (guanine(966)-N(2))-methyltransferase RsmD [Deferribacteres bacterium]|nr:16S rRNA (guanine(966)-N(2))-methyltransferase RsmD [Deferribacteres bacterium]
MISLTGGKDKGRKIKSPRSSGVRPILASIRKVLFDTLGVRVYDARFLDVFAGVGTVGLEALSRGAKEVFYVEKNPRVIKILRENVSLLGYEDKVQIIRADAFKVPQKLKACAPFDIVYLGPPYGLKGIERLPQLYLPLAGDVLVIQHHHKTKFDFPEGFRVKIKRIGENQLTFVEKEGK